MKIHDSLPNDHLMFLQITYLYHFKDKVAGALARISTVSCGPESNELASKIFERLPLNEDFSEWGSILSSVEFFIKNGNQKVTYCKTQFFLSERIHFDLILKYV